MEPEWCDPNAGWGYVKLVVIPVEKSYMMGPRSLTQALLERGAPLINEGARIMPVVMPSTLESKRLTRGSKDSFITR
jgi:hypothetical protein